MPTAYIALGSNLGDRQATFREALAAMGGLATTKVRGVAPFIETDPVDSPPESPRFLNTVACLETDLSAEELLGHLLEIEWDHGRDRGSPSYAQNAPRTLDLDLLLYDELILSSPNLTLPHPRMHERYFVLEPLAKIAPDLLHPVTHRTIQQMLDSLTTRSETP